MKSEGRVLKWRRRGHEGEGEAPSHHPSSVQSQNIDIAKNDLSESFVARNRPVSNRVQLHSTLYASSRLKSSSSSKSLREMVSTLVPLLEMASVERSLRSKTAQERNCVRHRSL